jgi:TatD DNase family protein
VKTGPDKKLTMNLIDTHSHVFLEDFDNDRDQVIQNSIDKNVTKIVLPNIDISSIDAVFDIQKNYPDICYPAMGLHPGSVKEDYIEQLKQIEKEIQNNQVYGIGETGLDFYWDTTFKESQIDSFVTQIKWAIQYDLPLIIHVRESFEETLQCVKENLKPGLKGVFHCFTGSVADAEKIFDLGFHIGIGGIVTFKNSGLGETVNNLPLERVILETDSPYLTPAPFRGKRNESAYVALVAQKIAELKNLPMEKIAEITSDNANRLFGFNK